MSDLTSSKLLRNLSKLPGRERVRFRDYVDSPFFNTHPCTRVLAHHLLAPETDWRSLTKRGLSEVLYPGKPVSETAVSNVMSYLMKLLEGFLTQLGLEASGQEDILMFRAAHQRQMTKFVSLGLKKVRKAEVKTQRRGSHQLMRTYLIDLLRYETLRQEERHLADKSLKEVLNVLDNWYQAIKLEKNCELMAMTETGEGRATIPPDLESQIERQSDEEPPLISIYRKCLLTIIRPDQPEHYFALKTMIGTHRPYLPEEDQVRIIRHLLNYCAKKINQHELSYRKEMFDLYKQAISNGMILKGGIIYQITYSNIVSLACFLGDFEWAISFIETYRKHLLKEARQNAYKFNLAKVILFQGRYYEALDMLGSVKFTNFFYQLRSRLYQIIAYYELREFSMVDSSIENLRLYMIRSREAAKFRKSGNRFVRFTRSLILLRVDRQRLGEKAFLQKLKALRQEIAESTESILEREWLQKKVEEGISGIAQRPAQDY